MRLVLQRVSEASVRVNERETGRIGAGLVVFVGVARGDTAGEAARMAEKTARLRIFPNEAGKFDRSLLDVGGAALVVSQFTLLADTSRGRRPYFGEAAEPGAAAPLVRAYAEALRALGVPVVEGEFGAMMRVALVNDGPVTVVLDSS